MMYVFNHVYDYLRVHLCWVAVEGYEFVIHKMAYLSNSVLQIAITCPLNSQTYAYCKITPPKTWVLYCQRGFRNRAQDMPGRGVTDKSVLGALSYKDINSVNILFEEVN